eukprot:g25568.t1
MSFNDLMHRQFEYKGNRLPEEISEFSGTVVSNLHRAQDMAKKEMISGANDLMRLTKQVKTAIRASSAGRESWVAEHSGSSRVPLQLPEYRTTFEFHAGTMRCWIFLLLLGGASALVRMHWSQAAHAGDSLLSPALAAPNEDLTFAAQSVCWDYCHLIQHIQPYYSIPLLVLWVLLLLWLLNDTAEVYFVPPLRYWSARLRLSPCLAGATLVAVGNGAPDLVMTALAPTTLESLHIVICDTVCILCVAGGAVVYLRARAQLETKETRGKSARGRLGGDPRSMSEVEPLNGSTYVAGAAWLGLALAYLLGLLVSSQINLGAALVMPTMYIGFMVTLSYLDNGAPFEVEPVMGPAPMLPGLAPPKEGGVGETIWWALTMSASPVALLVFALWSSGAGFRWFVTSSWSMAFAVLAIALSTVLLLCSEDGHLPRLYPLTTLLAKVSSVLLLLAIARELTVCFKTVCLFLGVSRFVLESTVVPWGNSLGDLVTAVAMVRQGQSEAAATALFAAPLFNVLVSAGLTLILTTSHGQVIALEDAMGQLKAGAVAIVACVVLLGALNFEKQVGWLGTFSLAAGAAMVAAWQSLLPQSSSFWAVQCAPGFTCASKLTSFPLGHDGVYHQEHGVKSMEPSDPDRFRNWLQTYEVGCPARGKITPAGKCKERVGAGLGFCYSAQGFEAGPGMPCQEPEDCLCVKAATPNGKLSLSHRHLENEEGQEPKSTRFPPDRKLQEGTYQVQEVSKCGTCEDLSFDRSHCEECENCVFKTKMLEGELVEGCWAKDGGSMRRRQLRGARLRARRWGRRGLDLTVVPHYKMWDPEEAFDPTGDEDSPEVEDQLALAPLQGTRMPYQSRREPLSRDSWVALYKDVAPRVQKAMDQVVKETIDAGTKASSIRCEDKLGKVLGEDIPGKIEKAAAMKNACLQMQDGQLLFSFEAFFHGRLGVTEEIANRIAIKQDAGFPHVDGIKCTMNDSVSEPGECDYLNCYTNDARFREAIKSLKKRNDRCYDEWEAKPPASTPPAPAAASAAGAAAVKAKEQLAPAAPTEPSAPAVPAAAPALQAKEGGIGAALMTEGPADVPVSSARSRVARLRCFL